MKKKKIKILPAKKVAIPYQKTIWGIVHDVVLALLAATSVAFLVFEETHKVPENLRQHFLIADFTIAVIFLTEWCWGYWRAPSKKAFWQEHWYELLASIPLELPVFEALRGLRIIRLIRLFRITHVSTHVQAVGKSFLNELGLRTMSLALTSGNIIFSGAVVFHQFEFGINPMVRGFFDSIWWAFTTTTWTSVGDVYPVTWEGRVTAMVLTLFGVGVLSSLIGFITKYILKKDTSGLKLINLNRSE